MNLVFATNNKHKVEEIEAKLGGQVDILTLSDIGCTDEIPEEQETIEGNASQKSHYLYNKYGQDCFSDDTGLEVEALDGRPGVYSARYAGEQKKPEDNINKLLKEMDGITNRKARFRTVISLIIAGKEHLFEGIVEGKILTERHGNGGFGYDPVFMPDGYDKSFAELSMEEKNKISHRGRAVSKLFDFINNL